MKTALSVLLIALIAGQVAYLPLLSAWLENRRDIIAQELCINRNRPELMCQGSCHINQVISDAMENGPSDEMPPASSQKEQNLFSVFLPGSIAFPAAPSAVLSPQPCYWHLAVPSIFNQSIFRPPRLG